MSYLKNVSIRFNITKRAKLISAKICHGFSLVELLLTIFIISIVMTYGFSSFCHMIYRLKLKSSTEQLQTLCQYARQYALLAHQKTRLCIEPVLSCGYSVHSAWMVQYQTKNGFRLLKQYDNSNHDLVVQASPHSAIVWNGRGTLMTLPREIRLCSSYLSTSQSILISRTGRVRLNFIDDRACSF